MLYKARKERRQPFHRNDSNLDVYYYVTRSTIIARVITYTTIVTASLRRDNFVLKLNEEVDSLLRSYAIIILSRGPIVITKCHL